VNKLLAILLGLIAASLLGGCMAVYEEHRHVHHPHGYYYGPPRGVVVVPAPPRHRGYYEHRW
jgi:hypothetical protein